MDFLRESFTLTLVESGTKGLSFAADVLDVRPSFTEILGYKQLADELGSKMVVAVARSRSSLVSMDLLMDRDGLIAVFTFNSRVQMSQAKTAVDLVIKAFPQQQRDALIRSFRPLDELDRNRIVAMATLGALRPCVPEAKPEPDETDESDDIFCIPGERRPSRKLTEAQCLALEEGPLDGVESSVDLVWPHTLTLTDNASVSDILAVQRAKIDWVDLAQMIGTISILSIGSCKLTYIRCHRESTRVLLLEAEVRSEHTLSHIYQIAAKMAEAGSLPDPSQTRVLKAEFKKRCIVVLKLTNPTVEFDIKKLPLKDQRNIITALGGVSGCEDCPKPAEQYHHWDHKLRCWSRQWYPASTPTSSLPETLALCRRCYERNPWSCTLCRRRDTFTACRGTRNIPNSFDSSGDCTVHRLVDCSCGGTFRKHKFS